MVLSSTKIQALKAAIIADAALNSLRAAHDTQGITDYLNSASTLAVWRTSVATKDLFDQIAWAALTPTDAPDGSLAWQCRSLACQGKQFNLQLIFASRDFIDPSKSNVRAGLQDALSNVPSGSAGALVSAGWVNVREAMKRMATNVEKVFANATPTPALLVVEGEIDELTIRRIAWSDAGVWQL